MCRHAPSTLPDPTNRANIIELSGAAGLSITSIILLAVYLTDREIDPYPGNVMLTGAGVFFVLAAILVFHCDVRRRFDALATETRTLRYYTMAGYAENVEADADPYTDSTISPIRRNGQ